MKQHHQFKLVSEALRWLIENQQEQPGLKELSNHIGLSQSHLQRTFKNHTGISPKQFLKYLTKEQALQRLRKGETVLNTAFDCGLSSTGRLHDLLVTTEAITPGEARRSGHGVEISYGYGMTPFGESLLGWTSRGISFLGFCHANGRINALAQLQREWPGALLAQEENEAQQKLREIFSDQSGKPLSICLRGSPFQLKVWEALLIIPPATHCTYGQIARYMDKPKASRAVGSAIGRNPVSWLIPCHRVITSMGKPGGYRWGINTKMAMIAYESAKSAA